MHQVVSEWQNWFRNLSNVNICFQRGSNEADCSIWLFCTVQKWNDICQECWIFGVPAYWQNVQKCGHIFTGFGMIVDVLLSTSWLMSWAAFWFIPPNFSHQTEFVIECVKASALYVDRWAETIRIASVHTRTLRKNVGHSHFLAEVITDDNKGSPCLK